MSEWDKIIIFKLFFYFTYAKECVKPEKTHEISSEDNNAFIKNLIEEKPMLFARISTDHSHHLSLPEEEKGQCRGFSSGINISYPLHFSVPEPLQHQASHPSRRFPPQSQQQERH